MIQPALKGLAVSRDFVGYMEVRTTLRRPWRTGVTISYVLTKQIGSLAHETNWSKFFLELWEELQSRARRNSGKKILAGSLTAEEVAERTSSAVGSENDSGALFDEIAEAYRKLRNRSEEMIIDTLNRTVREGLRSYSRM